MINKLIDNCFQTELNTIVTDVMEENSYYWHACKETIFFMEGGGMRSDIGAISGHMVKAMKVEDGKQWHLLDTLLEEGSNVFMSVNLHERFRKCQIHTTQHLISALLGNVYNVHTLSHHVGDEENDIEFDFENFTDKMATELMVLCNGLIRDDLEISVVYPTRKEAALHVPSEKITHDDIRVVKIGNLDYNLCGCMHVPSLRYVQMVYIQGYEKTTKGYKIKYICGDQLLDCVGKRYGVLDEASHTLALSHLYLNTGIHKLVNEQKALTRDIMEWKQKYFEKVADELCAKNAELIVHEFEDIDVKSTAQFGQFLTTHYQRAAVLLTKIEDKAHLVIATPKDCNEDALACFKEIANAHALQGGGTAQLAQGGGIYTKELSDYIKTIQKI